MSKFLASLLGADHKLTAAMLDRLESASANSGVDVRLTAEIRQGVHTKMAELGLDPADTTGEELYQVLQVKAAQDTALLLETIGIKSNADSAIMIQALAKYFAKKQDTGEIWSLKRTVLKKLLTQHVPHKTMKALHYRSIASMLKRETPATVYAVATLVEGEKYKHMLIKSINNLSPSDFELRRIEFVSFTPELWEDIKKHLKVSAVPVFGLPEANAIVIIPAQTSRTHTLGLLVCALIFHEIRCIKEHASYLKFRSLDVDLHEHVQTIALQGQIKSLTFHDQPVYWHHLHRHFAKIPALPEYLQPHVAHEDLAWIGLEAALSGIDVRLSFWVGTHELAFVSDAHIVSLHIIDVCFNALYQLNSREASTRFVRDAVWDELLGRYLLQAPFSNMIERHMYKMTDKESDFAV